MFGDDALVKETSLATPPPPPPGFCNAFHHPHLVPNLVSLSRFNDFVNLYSPKPVDHCRYQQLEENVFFYMPD